MFGVDVREFDGHKVLDHDVRGGQPTPQQLSNDIHDFFVKFGEAQHLLLHLAAAMLKETNFFEKLNKN